MVGTRPLPSLEGNRQKEGEKQEIEREREQEREREREQGEGEIQGAREQRQTSGVVRSMVRTRSFLSFEADMREEGEKQEGAREPDTEGGGSENRGGGEVDGAYALPPLLQGRKGGGGRETGER